MSNKTKKSKKGKQNNVVPSKKSESKKPTKKRPAKPKSTQPTEPQAQPPTTSALTVVQTKPRKKATIQPIVTVGRFVVYPTRNVSDEITIIDALSGKAVISIPDSVPVNVLSWIMQRLGEFVDDVPSVKALSGVGQHRVTVAVSAFKAVGALAIV